MLWLGVESLWEGLKGWDAAWKIHPILVNFTAALVPVSVFSDLLGRLRASEALRQTAWWTLVYAAAITPLTALFGWGFWMDDDNGHVTMTVHKWLGTCLPVVLAGLLVWRWWYWRRGRGAGRVYLLVGLVVVGVLIVQGTLGGSQTFGGGM